MRVLFISPAAAGACAVGDTYKHDVAAALRIAGHSAEIVPPDAWRSFEPEARIVIDVATLAALADDVDTLVARRAVGFVQYPSALETAPDARPPALSYLPQMQLLRRLERLIVTSNAIAERLRADFGVAAEAISVVTPGIEERVRSQGSGGPGCAILSVGALVPNAGHDELLRALARLFDLDWRLTIVGAAKLDQVHAQTLVAVVDELGIANRVVFVDQPTPGDLEALWRHADLFALGAAQQGYATTTAEALRRGVPVAVVAGDDAAKLVSADAGAVCPPGDRDTLSKSLRRLIFDTALRRDMAEAAWKIGQALHDWPTQARAFAEALAI